jgi:hypothetical protein
VYGAALYSQLADLLVILHLVWVVFMVGGVLATLVGLVWTRILQYRLWRWLHVGGMVFAGILSVAGRLCPLTTLEYALRRRAGLEPQPEEGFIIRIANRLIFPNLDPHLIAAITLAAAGIVLVVFVWKPPGRPTESTQSAGSGQGDSKR